MLKVNNLIGFGNNPLKPNPLWSSVTLQMQFESSTTLDDKGNTFTAYGNSQLTTSDALIGASSLLLDGSGDYLQSNSRIVGCEFGSGDFAITAKIKPTSSNIQAILQYGNPAISAAEDLGFYVGVHPTSFEFVMYHGSSVTAKNALFDFSDGRAHTIGISRSSGTVYMAVDNVILLSERMTVTQNAKSTFRVRVGSRQNASPAYFNGVIDAIQVIKGSPLDLTQPIFNNYPTF